MPSLSEVFAATERTGLWAADMEVLRRPYEYTLHHRRDRFAAHRAQGVAISGERFCRMWEYYLAAVQVGFRNGSNMVFQIALSRQIGKRKPPPTVDGVSYQAARASTASLQFQGRSSESLEAPRVSWSMV